jgi:hypothetical protein
MVVRTSGGMTRSARTSTSAVPSGALATGRDPATRGTHHALDELRR